MLENNTVWNEGGIRERKAFLVFPLAAVRAVLWRFFGSLGFGGVGGR
jgi:hypothetical protein